MHWHCKHTWKQSAVNTSWCLLGCSIGDFGTIGFLQWLHITWAPLHVMALATLNGLLTSIGLETTILMRTQQMPLPNAFKTAIGMSFISMTAMETAMNLTDYWLTGGARLVWWAIPFALVVGFITPWPYNYWRLKRWGKACH